MDLAFTICPLFEQQFFRESKLLVLLNSLEKLQEKLESFEILYQMLVVIYPFKNVDPFSIWKKFIDNFNKNVDIPSHYFLLIFYFLGVFGPIIVFN